MHLVLIYNDYLSLFLKFKIQMKLPKLGTMTLDVLKVLNKESPVYVYYLKVDNLFVETPSNCPPLTKYIVSIFNPFLKQFYTHLWVHP